jgi:AraC-like DNA-binding protein
MPDPFRSVVAARVPSLLWVDLTHRTSTALVDALTGAFDIRRVTDPTQIHIAIQIYTPHFLCFEFDEPDTPGIDALTHTRHEHPSLPILMITHFYSEPVALWALRVRVWDLVVMPVPIGEISRRIAALATMTRQRAPRARRHIVFPPQCCEPPGTLHDIDRHRRTYPAIAHVAAHFDRSIALDHVCALCRLSPSQFCREFRQAYGLSFGQYLLRYRIARAREYLANPDKLVKEVAYSVGFNDHSYFARAFKRLIGVCPSEYQACARSTYK